MAARNALTEILKKRGRLPSVFSPRVLADAVPCAAHGQKSGAAGTADSVGVTSPETNKWCRLGWLLAAGGVATLPAVVSPSESIAFSEASSEGSAGKSASGGPDGSFKPQIIFVLGGPGSGKGTQCAKIVEEYGFTHLSAGDLLRAEIKSGSSHGNMIQNMIKEGKIVPAEVTVGLLQKAMKESGNNKFLIDGFPRNNDNRTVFEKQTGVDPEFILFFDCPEDVMVKRLLGRNQGRIDDNMDTIKKRFRVFLDQSIPVVNHYDLRGKVRKIDATRSPDEVFQAVSPLFTKFREGDLLDHTKALLNAVDTGDYKTYSNLSDAQLTAFEPEAQGGLVKGLDFHKYYFDRSSGNGSSKSTMVAPHIAIAGNAGIVSYTRLIQMTDASGKVESKAFNETRVWERRKTADGAWEWKNIHFHRSQAQG
ncbi:hypothetical protein CLOM_g12920 [Closterium sp. NIES-68]|nr:hypothetical protein CLOM_g12920 [Closterium sp. NIES-68]GJP61550.1 hypothetical protein CLOP_g18696 [Closterium sp. NIES-67]GJP83184.1 hypothetical protein CLOP_g13373 [Closterium sp. NIES-67]